MFLSRLSINSPSVRNPYEVHRILWRLFPHEADRERDFLYRVESQKGRIAMVLMQSVRKPHQPDNSLAHVIGCREYPLNINEGNLLRFLLVSNPIRTIRDEQGRLDSKGDVKKCRVPIINEDKQKEWLERKLEQSARIQLLEISSQPPVYFRKRKENRSGKIQPVAFSGILRVEDSQSLVELISKGVGPAKGFGCGMLSIAPA